MGLWILGLGLLPLYWLAARWADFARLQREGVSGAYFGSVVAVIVLWLLRTEIQPGLVWHLSGVVFLTLAWGWSLALLGGAVAQAALVLADVHDWVSVLPTLWVLVVLPASLTQLVLGLVRAWLPKHFFIYVFINAFFCGALMAAVMVGSSVLLLLAAGHEWGSLRDGVVSLLPLMLFPEAFLNGAVITVLAGLRPEWVWSFRDEEYLHR
ncbi:MAG: hypothetical protein D6720_04640 [Gammaproteobacteria bacterium]|nr:MAG: hypothetical protein D6720_04640 [Gammaproteobacteria bacterium]